MLKYRIQGSSNAIKMGIRIIMRSDKVEIISISDLFEENDPGHHKRVYIDVEKVPHMNERIRYENNEMCRRFFESKTAQSKNGRASGKSYR